jgi:predicted RNase H-like HicB family nuclease
LATRFYTALPVRDVDRTADTGLGVVFPDLPGCVTQGDTPHHAAEMAIEALALHIESMVEDGEAPPEPSPPGAVPTWVDSAETALVTHLSVPVELPGRSVRVNITMDENLLQRADRAASEHGMTRSGLLAEAVRAWLRESRRGSRKRAS